MTLKDKIIFVTGASAGFGASITRLVIKHGAKVIATGRRKERLHELQKELGNNLFPLQLDVTDRKATEKAISTLPKEFSSINVLINNAGLALGLDPAHKASLDDWENMVNTNIKGLLYVTRTILPGMVERNKGDIINIGSIAGEIPYPNGNVYGATKAFVEHFSKNLKADLLGTALRVTNIEPGLSGGTEFSDIRYKGDKERVHKIYHGAHALTPEDIAETVLWVISRPSHVNINTISLMPVTQAYAGLSVHRD